MTRPWVVQIRATIDSPRLMSLIATLSIAKRMPQRSIQKLLESLYGVHVSLGEITGLLHKVASFAKGTAQWILRKIRGSPHAHGDETGWREDGINAAERSIRPAVIARKVSGGTRSENGSSTPSTLMSVFGTWALQGKDLLAACTDMIVESQMHTVNCPR